MQDRMWFLIHEPHIIVHLQQEVQGQTEHQQEKSSIGDTHMEGEHTLAGPGLRFTP